MKAVIEGLLFISGDEGLTLDELKNRPTFRPAFPRCPPRQQRQ